MKKKTALIFGINGQDGAYLAKRLIDKKYSVFGITRTKRYTNLRKLEIIKKIRLFNFSKFDDVKIKFENNSIYSSNFDLFIRNDIAKIYNDVSFNSNLSKIKADIVNIDLLSGNINVDMFDKSNKVKLLKK